LEAGAKSDEHAFDQKYHGDVEAIIALLLARQVGEVFRADSDAVSIAINSPRGACIEALLNLTLRSCRLADRQNNKDHSAAWKHFEHYYDEELRRAEISEHEFSTLVTNYLPNFLYLSREWVHANLRNIFNAENYLQWLCAMQGYSYVGTVYQDIYAFLKDQGHFLRILDDANVKGKVSEKVVQNIVVAYLNDFESLSGDNSLIRALVQRQNTDELSQLIWFVWTLHKESDVKLRNKVYELWPALMGRVDTSTKAGRRLASNLCHWSVFVDELDEERKALLMALAPYADYSHNSYILLKSLADLSEEQPFEVNEIWLKILEESAPDYPAEAIRTILANLISRGEDGKRIARNTVSEYLKRGIEKPSRMLREILGSQEVADSR
jgi:hypothetical protein